MLSFAIYLNFICFVLFLFYLFISLNDYFTDFTRFLFSEFTFLFRTLFIIIKFKISFFQPEAIFSKLWVSICFIFLLFLQRNVMCVCVCLKLNSSLTVTLVVNLTHSLTHSFIHSCMHSFQLIWDSLLFNFYLICMFHLQKEMIKKSMRSKLRWKKNLVFFSN